MKKALDADTGVNDVDRGVGQGTGISATQSAIQAKGAGSISSLERRNYEEFVESLINDAVWMQREFSLASYEERRGDDEVDPQELQEAQLLHLAIQSIDRVKLIENSTIYADPMLQQQQSAQLFNLSMGAFQLMNQLGEAPNLVELYKSVLRAYGIKNVETATIKTGGIAQAQHSLEQEQGQQPPVDPNQAV